MRIAYVLAEYPKCSETFVTREIRAVRDAGHEVIVFALRADKERAQGVRYRRGVFLPGVVGNVMVTLCTMPGRLCVAWWRFMKMGVRSRMVFRYVRNACVAIDFAERARRAGCTHVHAHFAFVPADMAAVMAALMRVPFSVSAHAWDITTPSASLLRARLQSAAFTAVCTEAGRERLAAAGADRLRVIRHGVYSDEYPEAGRGGHRIVAVGRLVPKKGFIYLLNACDILKRRDVPFRCTIVGAGPQRALLEGMVQDMGLQDAVELVGEQDQAGVKAQLESSAVFVLPSIRTAEGDSDGLSNALVEAMAAGLPVITTDVSAAKELVRDAETGLLIPEKDAIALADRIEALLVSPDERDRVGRAARAEIQREWDIRHHVQGLIDSFLAAGSDVHS